MTDAMLKASDLVKALQRAIEVNGDLPVATEGCDCYGDAAGVRVEEGATSGIDGAFLLITREPPE